LVGAGVSGSSVVGSEVGSSRTIVGEAVVPPGSGVGTSGVSVGGFVSPGPFVGVDVSTTGDAVSVGGALFGDLVGGLSSHSGEQQSHSTSEQSTERILQSSFSALARHTSSGIDPSRLFPSNLATTIGSKRKNRNMCGQMMKTRRNKNTSNRHLHQ
jgi:hypothetical protein